MGCSREGKGPPASCSRPWGRKRGAWGLPRIGPRGPRVGWVLRSASAWGEAGRRHRGEDPPQREQGRCWGEVVGEGSKRSWGLAVGGRAPQPLTLAGAGSPSVIAGSKDTVGKANGPREVSCSRSRWPKSACHGEQGRGHRSQTSTPGLPSPEPPGGSGPGCPDPVAPARSGLLAEKKAEPQNCPREPGLARAYLGAQDWVRAVLAVIGGTAARGWRAAATRGRV